MAIRKFLLVACMALLFIGGLGGPAWPSYITDDYWGATPVGPDNADVIGADEHFDISGMDVALTSTSFNAKIYSNYFDTASYGKYGTQIGDLFISVDGWHPHGSAPYTEDNYLNGEDWEIAILLTDKPSAFSNGFSSNALIYETKDGTIVNTPPTPVPSSWGAYRQGQELWYTPGTDQVALYEGTWTLNDGFLEIEFDFSADPIEGLPDVTGYHWTYSCANDVIEGSVPVPPSLLLLGTGLIGLVGFRKTKR